MSDNIAADQLRLMIERIERLEEEKKGISDDIKDVYGEAKSTGYDVKTIRAIVRLRKMEAHARREAEALLDTYKAALGMLDGTPLGRWAVDRLDKTDGEGAGDQPQGSDPAMTQAAEPTPADIEEARAAGRLAGLEGRQVTSNPYPARDLRRAAWDEAWCAALGSDGMDIPDALKAPPKPKKNGDAEKSAAE